ncbi:MAG: dipeptidase [Candidatus Bathyarchaeota archaeon]|nr:dipeptidase [Candidatus Bathyarchaeota archaeon]
MDEYPLRLHRQALVVDTHCDTLKCLLPQFTRPRDSMWGDRSKVGFGKRSKLGHIDLPRLKEGGVDLQVFAISSERDPTPAYPLRTAMEMIEAFYTECEKYPKLVQPVTTYAEVMQANEEGRIAAMLSIEGADVIEGRLSMLRVYHRLGVRMVGLVHSLRNLLADGVADTRTKGGLSRLGVEVVEELNRLGMIVDVSHLSDAGFWDVLEASKDPIVASHSNSRAVCSHPRNMTDEMIKALAEKGGVMGMNFAPDFVHKTKPSVETLVDHIDHIVDLVGPEHVGLGSDFDGIPATPAGLEDASKMPAITEELVKRGYSEEYIRLILGGNHLRLIKKVVG